MTECFKRLTLTPDQISEIGPMLTASRALSGAVFAQVRRGAFPEHERLFLVCVYVPQASTARLRKWFDAEMERLAGVTVPKPKKKPTTNGI